MRNRKTLPFVRGKPSPALKRIKRCNNPKKLIDMAVKYDIEASKTFSMDRAVHLRTLKTIAVLKSIYIKNGEKLTPIEMGLLIQHGLIKL